MADMLRAFGVGVQTVAGTPATVTWLDFVEEYSHRPNLTFDVPKFKTNQRWMEKKIIAKTRYDEVTVRGRVDSVEIGLLLTSALGTPTSGVYKAGGSNNKLLTVSWADGGSTGQMWQMIDGAVNTMEMNFDAANGTITFSATIRGVGAVPVTYVAPTYSPPSGTVPFGVWQTLLKRSGTALCIVSARWTINNNREPFYCSPTVAATTTTEAGLYPSRFLEGEVTGTWDIVYEYTTDVLPAPDSSFYNFRHQIYEVWTIDAKDPATGGTAEMLISLPKIGYTSGELDRTKPNVLQHVSGSILYNDADLTGLVVTLTS